MRADIRPPPGLDLREPDEEVVKGDLILGMDAHGELPEWTEAGSQVGTFVGNRMVAYRVTRRYVVVVEQVLRKSQAFTVVAADSEEAEEAALHLARRTYWDGDTPSSAFEVLDVSVE